MPTSYLIRGVIINRDNRGNKSMTNISSLTTAFRDLKAIENNIFKVLMNH